MNLRNRALRQEKNRPRQTYNEGTLEYEISELCYEKFLELTGVAYSTINRSYPKHEREDKTDKQKAAKLHYLWQSSHAQAKEFLTRYKNIIRDGVLPLVIITKHKNAYDDSQDKHTQEFKKLIIDNCLFMLYSKLKDFGPLLIEETYLDGYYKVLDTTYESVKKDLLSSLANYEAEGRLKESDFEGIK